MQPILHHTTKRFTQLSYLTNQLLDKAGGLQRVCILSARILIGLFFVYFGMDKFIHYSDTTVFMSAMGVPSLLLPLVLILEIGGGVALIIGWRLRLMAGLLAAFTALATLIFHTGFSEQIQVILFMKNIAIIGGLLLIIAVADVAVNRQTRGGKAAR